MRRRKLTVLHWRFSVFRRARATATAVAVLSALLASPLLPATALSDGDPGSDVLLAQNLFVSWDANLTAAQQIHLGDVLNGTAQAGAPVRVAIIARRDDLGTVTALWQQPQTYANYLGYELSLAYTGRLLVVMPNGYGVYWHADPGAQAKLAQALAGQRPASGSAAGLTAGAVSAVDEIESAAGIGTGKLARLSSPTTPVAPAPASGPAPKASPNSSPPARAAHSDAWLGVVVAILALLALAVFVALRRGRLSVRRQRPGNRAGANGVVGRRVVRSRLLSLPVAMLALVLVALLVNQAGSTPATAVGGEALASNPELDPGTALHGLAAPDFTLVDESGQRVSLSQYRGKVVILSFVDAECQTICPLTTQAMLDAKAALGKAGKQVQLLGIDANWKSTQVDDVLIYSELHGLTGRWHFLTGALPQLRRVWTAYNVNEQALEDAGSNDIEHVAATYVINRQGKLSDVFTTQPSYAAIGQMGELLARDAAALLPGHPRVGQDYSYGEIPGVTPDQSAVLPALGGSRVKLGPGAPHLYLFFATWDVQTTPIAAKLDALNAYQAAARREGLPPLTAIDEGSVEPSHTALPSFVRGLASPLAYPVAIDSTGRVADGYDVEGEPWFVETNAAGDIVWYQEVYTQGWPTTATLIQEVKSGLKASPTGPVSTAAARLALAGSPAPTASLHAQSSQLLGGGQAALDARIAKLRGYPIVVNIWASWCQPCQKEFGLFSRASALYGKRVAFLGADTEDEPPNARAFLRAHPVSYPSYAVTDTSIDKLLSGGLQGTPTTLFIGADGRIVSVHSGEYDSLGELERDIQTAALSAG